MALGFHAGSLLMLILSSLHRVEVGSIADVSELCIPSVFKVKISKASQCSYICTFGGAGALPWAIEIVGMVILVTSETLVTLPHPYDTMTQKQN